MSRIGPQFFGVIPRAAVWGGTRCREFFGYDVPDTTGQVWAFAAQPGGDTACIKGEMKGFTLGELWVRYPELFRSSYEQFPLIISLVAPVQDLSVQVHPTAQVARTMGYPRGKNEAWLMLESDPQARLTYGLTLPVKEAIDKIRVGEFEGLFGELPTHTGEFFYIPAGTVHALGRGNVTYEVQQATDLTFRMYDYGRVDAEGKPRQLNLDLAIASIEAAEESLNTSLDYVHPAPSICAREDATVTQHIANDSFAIASIEVDGSASFALDGYWLCTVTRGSGSLNGVSIGFGDNILLPACMEEVSMEGAFSLAVTSEGPVISL